MSLCKGRIALIKRDPKRKEVKMLQKRTEQKSDFQQKAMPHK
jgi:hypothetical protein